MAYAGLTRGVPYQRAVSADFVAQHHANVHAPQNGKASTQGLHVLFNMHMLYVLSGNGNAETNLLDVHESTGFSNNAVVNNVVMTAYRKHPQRRCNSWHKSCREGLLFLESCHWPT